MIDYLYITLFCLGFVQLFQIQFAPIFSMENVSLKLHHLNDTSNTPPPIKSTSNSRNIQYDSFIAANLFKSFGKQITDNKHPITEKVPECFL